MPHAKCVHCRSRMWLDGSADEGHPHLCSGCGGELQPVVNLSELVGLRALGVRPRPTPRDDVDRFERISRQIRETIAGHDAERQRRLDADHS